MKIAIGAHVFPSKKAAQEAVREVLNRYGCGETLNVVDALFVLALLYRHREAAQKIGPGVASFQVESNGPTRGFWVTRVDGTRTDFSYLSCLTPPSPEQEAQAGFRAEVRDQIQAFKAWAFSLVSSYACPVTGDPITATTCHVDHAPSFADLVRGFLSEEGIVLGSVAVETTRDGETETRLADRALAARWAAFHARRARLRCVSARANLSVLRRTR